MKFKAWLQKNWDRFLVECEGAEDKASTFDYLSMTMSLFTDDSLSKAFPIVHWAFDRLLTFEVSSIATELLGSAFEQIYSDKRRSLAPETVADLLNLKWNGPDVSRFNARFYAKMWKADGHRSAVKEDPRSDPMSKVMRRLKAEARAKYATPLHR